MSQHKHKIKNLTSQSEVKKHHPAFYLACFLMVVLVCMLAFNYNKRLTSAPTSQDVVDSSPTIKAEPVKAVPVIAAFDYIIPDIQKLDIWRIIVRLGWDRPRALARVVAKDFTDSKITSRTKFKDLTPDQQSKLFEYILKEGTIKR